MILPNSAKSRSSRTDGAHCCAPLRDRRLTHFVEPSVSPCRRYSRNSHALQQRPDTLETVVPKSKRDVYCLVLQLYFRYWWESWVKAKAEEPPVPTWRRTNQFRGLKRYHHDLDFLFPRQGH